MRIFKEISSLEFIDSEGMILEKSIETVNKDFSDLMVLQDESIYKNHYSEPLAERVLSSNPYFLLVKIYIPKNFNKILMKDAQGNKLFFFTIDEDRVKFPSILRLIDVDENSPVDLENFIHTKSSKIHSKGIKECLENFKDKDLFKKNVFNVYYENLESDNINSNIITKDFQLFYMGNLIGDNKNFRS